MRHIARLAGWAAWAAPPDAGHPHRRAVRMRLRFVQ